MGVLLQTFHILLMQKKLSFSYYKVQISRCKISNIMRVCHHHWVAPQIWQNVLSFTFTKEDLWTESIQESQWLWQIPSIYNQVLDIAKLNINDPKVLMLGKHWYMSQQHCGEDCYTGGSKKVGTVHMYLLYTPRDTKGLHNWVSFSYTKELAIYPRTKIFPFLPLPFWYSYSFLFPWLFLILCLIHLKPKRSMQKPKYSGPKKGKK